MGFVLIVDTPIGEGSTWANRLLGTGWSCGMAGPRDRDPSGTFRAIPCSARRSVVPRWLSLLVWRLSLEGKN